MKKYAALLAVCMLMVSSCARAEIDERLNAEKWTDYNNVSIREIFGDYDGVFGTNCLMFARLVIFTLTDGKINFNSNNANSMREIVGMLNYAVAQHLNERDGTPAEAGMQAVFSRAQAGDVVQMRWTWGQHTFVIAGVEDDGIHILQSNVDGRGIENRKYTWSDLQGFYSGAGDVGGFTVYRLLESAPLPEGSVRIDEENFPDEIFRAYVSEHCDTDNNGELSTEEIVGVGEMRLAGLSITDLKGIEHFTALQYLYCYANKLTALDVSKNTALKDLFCSINQLTELEVSKNTALTTLYCYNNKLTELDVSKNTALQYLYCEGNKLTALDVSKNTALTNLSCGDNKLTELNVSKNTALTTLYCYNNKLTEFDVSKNTALQYLYCEDNKLTALDVSKNTDLKWLYFHNNKLTTIDLSKNTALTWLDCHHNQITILDVSNCPADIYIACDEGVTIIRENANATKPSITTTSLKTGTIGESYTATLTASGTTPITWTRKSGSLPKGLTLSDSGIISGTTTKAGKYTFTITASNTDGSDARKFSLQVCDPVSITTASLKAATVAKSYSANLKAKGTKPLTWSAIGLPDGLTLNAKTGKISGKPSAHGTFSVKITATNPAQIITKELLLTVKGISPKLSGSLTKAELGKIYSSGLKLTAGSLPVTWSMTGTLPDGLTFDANTGTISGTPTSYAKSGYKLTITAKNDAGEKSKNVTLTVKATAPKITTKKLPDATAGSPYTAILTATGSTPITWTADGLPDGLYIDGSIITGIPKQSGNKFTVTLHAENPVKSASRPLTLKVNPAQNESLPAIHETSGEAYSALPSAHSEETTQPNSGGYIIVAELGEISCDMAGMYEFDVVLNDNASEGAELVYMAGSDNPSDDDDIAEFFDSEGNPVTTVPENCEITLSIWLNPQIIYRPALAIKH